MRPASLTSRMSTSTGYGTIPKENGANPVRLIAGRMDTSFMMSQKGAIKSLQIVISLAAFISACINPWWVRWGGGWVQFVTIAAFAWALLSYCLHLCRAFSNQSTRCFHVTEAIVYSIFTVCLLSAGIIAANRAYSRSSIVASAIFTIITTVLFAVESLLLFRDWSELRGSSASQTPVSGSDNPQPSNNPDV